MIDLRHTGVETFSYDEVVGLRKYGFGPNTWRVRAKEGAQGV